MRLDTASHSRLIRTSTKRYPHADHSDCSTRRWGTRWERLQQLIFLERHISPHHRTSHTPGRQKRAINWRCVFYLSPGVQIWDYNEAYIKLQLFINNRKSGNVRHNPSVNISTLTRSPNSQNHRVGGGDQRAPFFMRLGSTKWYACTSLWTHISFTCGPVEPIRITWLPVHLQSWDTVYEKKKKRARQASCRKVCWLVKTAILK